MRIGIIIGRIGGVDGVALETMKWIDVLKKMGHKVFLISGEFENWEMQNPDHFHCPLLSFFSPEADNIIEKPVQKRDFRKLLRKAKLIN